MFEIPLQNKPFVPIDVHVPGRMIPGPSQEHVIAPTNFTHEMLPHKVTDVKEHDSGCASGGETQQKGFPPHAGRTTKALADLLGREYPEERG